MKTAITIFKKSTFALSTIAILSTLSPKASAQQTCPYYKEIIAAAKSEGWTIVKNSYNYISQGNSIEVQYYFSSGYSYRIIAITCTQAVTDLDLYLYENDYSEYSKDLNYKDYGAVDFYPQSSRYMRAVAKNVSSTSPYSDAIVSIIILRK